MRKIVRWVASTPLLALTVATVTQTPADAQDASFGPVAVVDVAYIFKNDPSIKSQIESVETKMKSIDGELKGKREELKNAAAQLKTFKPGTPEYAAAEEKVAGMESKLRLEMARKRKELADAEAQVYFDNYQTIAQGVKLLAQHYKVSLVLRYNSEDMDKAKGESVVRGVMKNVVYHDDKIDMTPAVMQYLNRVAKR